MGADVIAFKYNYIYHITSHYIPTLWLLLYREQQKNNIFHIYQDTGQVTAD